MKLIFVYSGKLPNYAYYSISHALENSFLEVYLLTSQPNSKLSKLKSVGLKVIDIKEFYIRDSFFMTYMSNVRRFRNGFWTKTLERFMILEQYVNLEDIGEFFHGELDNLFFGLQDVVSIINESKKTGIFLPRLDNNHLIASLVYCNDRQELTKFITHLNRNDNNKNEMELLSNWQKNSLSNVHIIKSLPFNSDQFEINLIDSKSHKSRKILFDGARYGQWLFGEDPRNRIGIVKNLDENLIKDQLWIKDSKFRFEKPNLIMQYNNNDFYLANIHIHSKIIRDLLKKNKFDKILINADKGKQTLISTNILSYLKVPLANIRKIIMNL